MTSQNGIRASQASIRPKADLTPKSDEVVVTARRTYLPKRKYFPRSSKRNFRCVSARRCSMEFELPRAGSVTDLSTYMDRAARAAGAKSPSTDCQSKGYRSRKVICSTKGVGAIDWRDWRNELYR